MSNASHPLPTATKAAVHAKAAVSVPPSLPARIDSTILAKHRKGDEPMVVVKVCGVGAVVPYEIRDTGTRILVMRWDTVLGGHIIRVPLSMWMANKAKFAHDLMDQRRLPHPLVVTFDTTPPAAAPAVDEKGEPVVLERRPRRPRPPQGGDWQGEAPDQLPGSPVTTEVEVGGKMVPVGSIPVEEAPLIVEIKKLLANSKKRVGDLAEELPADEDLVREAIASDGSGLHVVGGWVKFIDDPSEG